MARRIVAGLLVGCATSIGAAFALAIGLAVLDLYLAGHGHPTLARPWIEMPAWGVHPGRADTIMLAGSAVIGVAAAIAVAVGGKPVRGGHDAGRQE